MPAPVEGVPATGEQPWWSAKMGMLLSGSCSSLVGICLALDSSRVIFLLAPSPSTALPPAAGRGEGGGGKAVSASVEAAVPGALVAGCAALSAAGSAGAGGLGCSRPALAPPRAASALYLHRATGQGFWSTVPA